ncbi:MAG: multiple sugar transport system permease protein [Frankiales bacterium]|jgi:multiple sugar transport system permease protein|nr:multiple sugar transport system permease protein [Frankiales bacterium]
MVATVHGSRPRKPAKRHRTAHGGRSFTATFLAYAVLVFLALVYLVPFLLQIVTSFKTQTDAANHPLGLIPHPVSTRDSIGRLANGSPGFPRALANSVLVTVLVTAGRVFLDSMAGYALARLRFPGRRIVFGAILAVLAVPGVVLLIPKFLVLNRLGIYDSYPALVLPLLADAAGIFIMKQFFESVSENIEEAARIDGAGTFRLFWSVVLPMARPALITLTILSFQGSWNEFAQVLVSVQSPQYYTLPLWLGNLVTGSLGAGTQYPLKLSGALLATIPVALVFALLQRYFIRGANEGAVKG